MKMPSYIEAGALLKELNDPDIFDTYNDYSMVFDTIDNFPTADVAPVRHGRWIYEVHKENTNFRWNVTAECSECCDNRKEIWGGFFPNVPDCIARDVALQSVKQIKLDNYCPHCGAKMDLKEV